MTNGVPGADNPTAAEWGLWLRRLMDLRERSIRSLAQEMGLDRTQVRRWLTGTVPDGQNLLLLLSALGGRIEPLHPDESPRALNDEIRELKEQVRRVADVLERQASVMEELVRNGDGRVEVRSEQR